jgi:hypothetical protein
MSTKRLVEFDSASSMFFLLLMITSSSMEVGLKAQNVIQIFRVTHGITFNTFKAKIFFRCP